MNLPLEEKMVRFNEAVKLLDNNVHISTLHRWADKGVRGVRLETAFLGGRRYTSKEAIRRFQSRLEKTEDDPGDSVNPRTITTREKAVRDAEEDLAKDGI